MNTLKTTSPNLSFLYFWKLKSLVPTYISIMQQVMGLWAQEAC